MKFETLKDSKFVIDKDQLGSIVGGERSETTDGGTKTGPTESTTFDYSADTAHYRDGEENWYAMDYHRTKETDPGGYA